MPVGMSYEPISEHLLEFYGLEVLPAKISRALINYYPLTYPPLILKNKFNIQILTQLSSNLVNQ